MSEHLTVINAYFDLVQAFSAEPEAYALVLHPEVEQTEYPNLLHHTIQRRSFEDILNNMRLARELLCEPHLEVEHTQELPNGSVLVEGLWQATTTSDVGPLMRGQRLRGHICLIFEFKDGKIYRQRRYAGYYVA